MRAASPRTLVLAGLLVAGAAAAEPPIGHLDGTGWPFRERPAPGLICAQVPMVPGMLTCQPQLRVRVDSIECALVYDYFDGELYSVICLDPEPQEDAARIMAPYVTPSDEKLRPGEEPPDVVVSYAEWPHGDVRIWWWAPSLTPQREELPEFLQRHLQAAQDEDENGR